MIFCININSDSIPNHGTNTALICLMDRIIKSMDSGDIVLGIFLDFSKAFAFEVF